MSNVDASMERVAPVVVDALQSARAVALLGARQAGKSTLARVLAGGPMPADYVTLDAIRSVLRPGPIRRVSWPRLGGPR